MLKKIISILLLAISLTVNAQDQISRQYEKVLIKLSNRSTNFFVTNPVRFKDSTGQVVSVRSIVELVDPYMKKIKKRYGKDLVNDLIILLNDPERDWAANVMLYAISEASAVILKFYNKNKINEWRTVRKENDIKKWRTYLATIKGSISSQ